MKTKIFVLAIAFLLITTVFLVSIEGNKTSVGEDSVIGQNLGDDANNIRSMGSRFENYERGYCQNSILIQLKPSSEILERNSENFLRNRVKHLTNLVDGEISRLYPSFDMAEIRLPESIGVINAIELLNRKEEVIHAEPNYLVEKSEIPNDPGYGSLWGLENIDAPGAWNLTKGSEEVVIPVVDTGIDYNHPDLKDNMWTNEEGYHGYNAVNDSYYPLDDNGHGSHVAGTIGAVGDNEIGIVGVNWNVSLMGIKVLDSEGNGNIGDVISGLEFVLERKREGENIVTTSNSWWGWRYSELLYEAIERHQKEGMLFVTAAGNEGRNNGETTSYPANYDLTNIISVAATNQTNNLAHFSNYGRRSVHVGAPGVQINSTMLDGEYSPKSGTSMAVPHVSGLVGLLASYNTSYDYNNLKNTILSSADTFTHLENRTLVGGRINASASLRQVPDPDDINFWVHRPYSTTQWGERTSITISLNDGVNPIHGADVRVEFSTDESPVYLEDDGRGRDQVAGDGYYTGEWRPRNRGQVELEITVELEEMDEKMTRTVSVYVRTVHPESAQRVAGDAFDLIRAILRALIDGLRNIFAQMDFSFEATYHSEVKSSIDGLYFPSPR